MNIKDFFKLSDKQYENIFKNMLNFLFQFHRRVYFAKNINYPKVPCIFALWHAHQCALYSLENREKINAMISRSKDGEIIAYAAEQLGFKTVRGSQTRGGASATLELIDRIKNGDSGAITIDGPRGPKYVVKKGIVEIARLTGTPIVPMVYYAGKNGFIKFKTWDEFAYPIPCKRVVTLYGDPIYVPSDVTPEGVEEIRKQIEDKLKSMFETLECDYKKLLKS